MQGKIILEEQQIQGTLDFYNTDKFMTKEFCEMFGDESRIIFAKAVMLIMKRYPYAADSIQKLSYETENATCKFTISHEEEIGKRGRLIATVVQ